MRRPRLRGDVVEQILSHHLTPFAVMTRNQPRLGFTLVELMVAIVIIGILMTITVTAVQRAIVTGRQTAMRMEVNALAGAVEQYFAKYGDYPPDGSSEAVLMGHMRKIFPRMSPLDRSLLQQLVQHRSSGDFSEVAMDRAEALVFFLGGFSDNPINPLTGEGGPLVLAPGVSPSDTTAIQNIANYQYNATRDNAFFDFDLNRLTIGRATDTAPLLSTDEVLLGVNEPGHGGRDPLPTYLARVDNPTPIVYFDSRTYGQLPSGIYNGYLAGTGSEFGGVRPYMTAALGGGTGNPNDLQFHNRETFQIISPGLDGVFGSMVSVDAGNPGAAPVYFITETGEAFGPVSPAPSINGFQDGDWLGLGVNGHLDNVTNFSTSTLESDLQ